jgi:hypothetical protein
MSRITQKSKKPNPNKTTILMMWEGGTRREKDKPNKPRCWITRQVNRKKKKSKPNNTTGINIESPIIPLCRSKVTRKIAFTRLPDAK